MTLVYRISVGGSGAGGSGDGDSLDTPPPPPHPASSKENSKNENLTNEKNVCITKFPNYSSTSLLLTTLNIKCHEWFLHI